MKNYLIIIFCFLLTSCFTEPKKPGETTENVEVIETVEEVINDYKVEPVVIEVPQTKFIYAKLKISKPVLYGTKSNALIDTPSSCDIMYEFAEYLTEIKEVDFYNEDVKYKVFDQGEKKMRDNSMAIQQNIYGNAVVDFGYQAAETIRNKDYTIKIIEKEILVFDSYAEASKSRK